MRDHFRPSDWLAGFSLANLVFLRCWAELLSPEETRIYWLMSVPAPLHYVSLMLDVLLLGAFFCALMGGIRRQSRTATRIMLVSGLAVLVSLVNSLRTLVSNPAGRSSSVSWNSAPPQSAWWPQLCSYAHWFSAAFAPCARCTNCWRSRRRF